MNSLKDILEQAANFNTPEALREQLVKQLALYPCAEAAAVLAKAAVVDPCPTVRRSATYALKSINPHKALDKFITNLNHQNPDILVNALHALRQLGDVNRDKALLAASRLLCSQHPRVCKTAAETVQKLTGAAAYPPHRLQPSPLMLVPRRTAFN